MPTGTLLFTTDLRTGYADSAALGAAVEGGAHPIFNLSSSGAADIGSRFTFDDVVMYLGAGTVKCTGFVYLDYLPVSPVTNWWMRSIVRFSPTFNTVSQALGRFGFMPSTYDDNVNYADFVTWLLEFDDAITSAIGEAYIGHNGEIGSEAGSLTAAALRDGSWRDIIVHYVRGASIIRADVWIGGTYFGTYAMTIPSGFVASLTNVEASWSAAPDPVPGSFTNTDATNNYLHIALVEAYTGGNPYDLIVPVQSGAGGRSPLAVLNG